MSDTPGEVTRTPVPVPTESNHAPATRFGTVEAWEDALNLFEALSEDYATAKARAEMLKVAKDSVKADIMAAAKDHPLGAQQRMADHDWRYIEACEAYALGLAEVERLKLRLKAGEIWFDMVRTAESTRRAEMQLAR